MRAFRSEQAMSSLMRRRARRLKSAASLPKVREHFVLRVLLKLVSPLSIC